jgi:hypothetical protein
MNIDELTYGQIKDISRMCGSSGAHKHGYGHLLGKPVFIRTVTMHYTGRLEAVHEQELVISDAAWIADSGRFADTLRSGDAKEVEPYPDGKVIVGRGGIIDVSAWATDLPREQK